MRCCQLHLAGLGRSAADETGETTALGLLVAASEMTGSCHGPRLQVARLTVLAPFNDEDCPSTWGMNDPLQLES